MEQSLLFALWGNLVQFFSLDFKNFSLFLGTSGNTLNFPSKQRGHDCPQVNMVCLIWPQTKTPQFQYPTVFFSTCLDCLFSVLMSSLKDDFFCFLNLTMKEVLVMPRYLLILTSSSSIFAWYTILFWLDIPPIGAEG